MRRLLRAVGRGVSEGFQTLGAAYFPLPPWQDFHQSPAAAAFLLGHYGIPTLAEPPPGSPERLTREGEATSAERSLISELSRDLRWPAERSGKEEAP
ncbi:DUF6059 family protein [Streptomyces sp. NPDC028722]|uniref:DUF6059 family protein n=1 Tax=unclassified Streptomyces TaxID=2593676 RepID=UPI00340666B5